jgi:hypothetical protein
MFCEDFRKSLQAKQNKGYLARVCNFSYARTDRVFPLWFFWPLAANCEVSYDHQTVAGKSSNRHEQQVLATRFSLPLY